PQNGGGLGKMGRQHGLSDSDAGAAPSARLWSWLGRRDAGEWRRSVGQDRGQRHLGVRVEEIPNRLRLASSKLNASMNGKLSVEKARAKIATPIFCCLLVLLMVHPLPAASLPTKVDFNYHIKPLLSDRCFTCHGPDEKARKAKLRLDTKEGGFKPLDDGMFVVKPGDLAHSEVARRITSTDPDEIMP